MRGLRQWAGKVVVGAMLVGLVGGVGRTQKAGMPLGSQGAEPGPAQMGVQPPHIGPPDSRDRDETMGNAREKQAKQRNEERQRRLEADTEKLLALATQLHEDVEKTNKDVLSLDVIRRADEIEKLAHGVKERMKG